MKMRGKYGQSLTEYEAGAPQSAHPLGVTLTFNGETVLEDELSAIALVLYKDRGTKVLFSGLEPESMVGVIYELALRLRELPIPEEHQVLVTAILAAMRPREEASGTVH